jgi:hypothetical protein
VIKLSALPANYRGHNPLRAAVVWTMRDTQAQAWRELSPMTGVASDLFGPGRGSTGPLELVALVHQPLSRLLGAVHQSAELGRLVLLDPDDQLPQAAIEEGCDYTRALFENVDDPGQRWLPSWGVATCRTGAAPGLRALDHFGK